MRSPYSKSHANGFTLIEVVLALGVFLISVLALVGLLAPMLRSVDNIEKMDEITSVVNTVNAFLQSSPDIAIREGTPLAVTKTKFNAIYEAVASEDYTTVFVFRRYVGSSTEVELIAGFQPEDSVSVDAVLSDTDFNDAAGPIYRIVLSASSVTPDDSLDSPTRDTDTGVYSLLTEDPAVYPEGYLALEARIFAEDPSLNYDMAKLPTGEDASLEELKKIEPDFTFNVAIVR